MIRVTVELLPYGSEEHKEVLGVAYIANDGTGSLATGNYNVELVKRGGKGLYKRARVEDFPRRRLLAWDLLYRALHQAVGHRNQPKPFRTVKEPAMPSSIDRSQLKRVLKELP